MQKTLSEKCPANLAGLGSGTINLPRAAVKGEGLESDSNFQSLSDKKQGYKEMHRGPLHYHIDFKYLETLRSPGGKRQAQPSQLSLPWPV